MASQNSSITRVRPFFRQLLGRSSTGERWLPSLLRAATHNRDYARALAADPGRLDRNGVCKRPYTDPVLGPISLECCFEKKLPPPEGFLAWLIQRPERMTWPVKNRATGEKKAFTGKTQAMRQALFSTNCERAAAARADATQLLAVHGVNGSEKKWWAFEGQTEADCCVETDTMVLLIEGKRNESLSPATDWFPKRNQLWRNVEVAAAIAKGRRYAVMLLAEQQEEVTDSLDASYPHLEKHERAFLASHYLGCVLWRDACAATGIDYGKLPHTVAEALAQ